jgi:hypothetical protein
MTVMIATTSQRERDRETERKREGFFESNKKNILGQSIQIMMRYTFEGCR